MQLSNFIEGLKTLQPYYKNIDGYHIFAAPGQFFAFAMNRPSTPEDMQKMRDFGWFQPDQDGDGYHTDAERDRFFAYATDHPLAPEDVQKMRDLGWFQSDQDDDAEYSSENGWNAFT